MRFSILIDAKQQILTDGILLEQTERHIHIQFDRPHSIISSAVLNGGSVRARHILNLNVGKKARGKSQISHSIKSACLRDRNLMILTIYEIINIHSCLTNPKRPTTACDAPGVYFSIKCKRFVWQ